MSDVTRILNTIERQDAKATDELLPLVYEELRVLAAQKLSHEPPGQTLQATALVHNAYVRLVGTDSMTLNSRSHFFSAAAEAMRRILVENARRKGSSKRGGQRKRVHFDGLEPAGSTGPDADGLIALDEALQRLSQIDSTKAGGQTPLLRRTDHRANGSQSGHLTGDRQMPVDVRPRVAHSRDGRHPIESGRCRNISLRVPEIHEPACSCISHCQ